ncbi:sulfite exporter TauE/SafE family protein [Mesorhizobium sp. Z1-4]|uniref:sulfite exporter TauE/SafE family protein n=1 Tax=Mesorhizobium sp. Z1-4 TaxID=2448478 RepID=UPI001FDF14AC|nr:sulfite exporter TauE/SafE family protein [Mesorhizobium sp. Z1-4]
MLEFLSDPRLIALLAVVAVAGVARGMSGFGTGMIVAPVAAALYSPRWAIVILVVIDLLPIIPITIPALRIARWREVLPIFAGLFLFFPVGLYILRNSDPVLLRWGISAAIFACVIMLWSGWRYSGRRTNPLSLATGSVAGVLSGIASIPGPPVLVYWLASAYPAAIIRANLLVLFFLAEFVSVGNLALAGMFERGPVMVALAATPVYFAGLLVGGRLFGLASERTYRLVTYWLIVLAAALALPLWDGVFALLGERFD